MGLGDMLKSGRRMADVGKSALRKVGQGAASIRKMAKSINDATGGAAGVAFEAAKALPGIGTVARNAEKGLNMAEKYSKKGISAIEKGERLANLGGKAAGGDLGAIGQLVGGKNLAGTAASTAARFLAPPGMGGMAANLAGKAMKSLFP